MRAIRGEVLHPRAMNLLFRTLLLGLASVTVEACKLTTADVVLESCVN